MTASTPDFAPFWEEVEYLFDPDQPVSVNQPELFAERERKYSPIAEIERRLRPQTRVRNKFLLTGTPGNGKTSELLHCTSRLIRRRMVVHTDIWEHLVTSVRDSGAINHLEPWELLGLIGVAVFRAGQDCFHGHNWKSSETKALEAALGKLQRGPAEGGPEVDVVALARGLAVAGGGYLGAALGPAGALLGAQVGDTALQAGAGIITKAAEALQWKWRLGRGQAPPLGDQDAEVQALLSAVNRLIMSLQESSKRPLLLILDGVDRVRDPERLRALFVESDLLSRLACDALVTAPLLPMRSAGQEIVGFDIHDLTNIPVIDRQDPERLGDGVAYFRDLLGRRLQWIRNKLTDTPYSCPAEPFPAAIVDRLAYLSGGITRDFIRLVRLVAIEALDAGADAITEELAAPAIRSERLRRERLMNSDEIAVLQRVIEDHQRRLPGDAIALDLLRRKLLVPYPNDSTWYYPHPLLTLGLLRRG